MKAASRAIRKGNWKLVAEMNAPWELYELNTDRMEMSTLAERYPEKVKALEKEYLQWSLKAGVADWNKIKLN